MIKEKNYYRLLAKVGFGKQIDGIIDRNSGDIDRSFLGFLDIYEALATIIPKDRVIYDFGCGYGFQSYFFRKHKKFVMVSLGEKKDVFMMPNSVFYPCEINLWLKSYGIESKNFAICSYVPLSSYQQIKNRFNDLFIFYPK